MARASFRQADIERILRAAARVRSTVQIDIRSLVITILPADTSKSVVGPDGLAPDGVEDWSKDGDPTTVRPEDFQSLAEWSAWRERERAKETTKSRFDYDRSQVPPKPINPDFNHREYKTMEHLVKLGPEVRIHWRDLSRFGPDTQKKLEKRGYLAVSYEDKHAGRLDMVWLTPAGAKAWRAMKAHWEKWPTL